ncbi:universal stress protein [Tsukamurella pseudospumae]|uniref:UspA domain-containing protein n=1 Tax=Tsukamurella pseudospumae TaxID=239498 RepID=A0A137ZR32_9ACTN|nr:universal stress protein [Tsukamurella pseudospumae]KXP00663.1 hypothetical protein AXK61_14650 [Tsukamurella pseudospumae]
MTKTHLDPYILVGVDGSAAANKAVRWAAAEADRRSKTLLIANITDVVGFGHVPEATLPGTSFFERVDSAGRDALSAAEQRVAKHFPSVRTTTIQTSGAPVAELIRLSGDAYLTVVGASGSGGVSSLLLGSVAMALVTDGHSPVAVIRGSENDGIVPTSGPVLLGVDAGRTSESAIAWAFDEASHRNTDLVALHAWTAYLDVYAHVYGLTAGVDLDAEAEGEKAAVAERLAGWQEKYPDVAVTNILRTGKPGPTLLADSANAQLVVVGSRGHGDATGVLFGSVSRALIHHAPCPVLVARNRDH